MKQIAVRVDDDLLAAIEITRGDVPREPWMRGVLQAATNAEPVPAAQQRRPAGSVPVRAGHLPTCKCPVCMPAKPARS